MPSCYELQPIDKVRQQHSRSNVTKVRAWNKRGQSCLDESVSHGADQLFGLIVFGCCTCQHSTLSSPYNEIVQLSSLAEHHNCFPHQPASFSHQNGNISSIPQLLLNPHPNGSIASSVFTDARAPPISRPPRYTTVSYRAQNRSCYRFRARPPSRPQPASHSLPPHVS